MWLLILGERGRKLEETGRKLKFVVSLERGNIHAGVGEISFHEICVDDILLKFHVSCNKLQVTATHRSTSVKPALEGVRPAFDILRISRYYSRYYSSAWRYLLDINHLNNEFCEAASLK